MAGRGEERENKVSRRESDDGKEETLTSRRDERGDGMTRALTPARLSARWEEIDARRDSVFLDINGYNVRNGRAACITAPRLSYLEYTASQR